jgi:hypothetical protein
LAIGLERREFHLPWVGNAGGRLIESDGLGFVLSHPFRDEAAKWMGTLHLWLIYF